MRGIFVTGILAVSSCIALLILYPIETTQPEPNAPAQKPIAKQGGGQVEIISRDEIKARLAEIDVLRNEVAELSKKLSELQSREQPQSEFARDLVAATSRRPGKARYYTVADRFEYETQTPQNLNIGDSNMEGAIYASVSSDIDVYSTECRGSLCKLYASASTGESYEDLSNEAFIENMNELLDGNVNIYFDEEGGQQVIYVESID